MTCFVSCSFSRINLGGKCQQLRLVCHLVGNWRHSFWLNAQPWRCCLLLICPLHWGKKHVRPCAAVGRRLFWIHIASFQVAWSLLQNGPSGLVPGLAAPEVSSGCLEHHAAIHMWRRWSSSGILIGKHLQTFHQTLRLCCSPGPLGSSEFLHQGTRRS